MIETFDRCDSSSGVFLYLCLFNIVIFVMKRSILNNHQAFGIILSILLSSFYILVFYHSVVFHPNRYLFTNEGDGLKTYYNMQWHGSHVEQIMEFKGMSYPYGECLIFEDSLPIYSIAIQQLASVFPQLNKNIIGILNLLLLISMVAGAVFMFLVLYHFSVPFYLAVLSGCAIVFLSSQTLLLSPVGHLGLAMVCFFPMGWYLLIKYNQDKNTYRWSILIAINVLFWTFIHVYLGLILLIFTTAVHFSQFIFNKKERVLYQRKWFLLGIQVVVPILIILSLFHIFDTHPDRIDMPFLDTYRASFQSVFLPVKSLFAPFYDLFFDFNPGSGLRWNNIGNYVGIVSNLAVVGFLSLSCYYLVVKKSQRIKRFFLLGFHNYFFGGIVLLLFAMAVPLRFLPEKMLTYIPLIKQFSALGRFAWGFYYVIAVFAIIFFVQISYKQSFGRILVFILIGFIFVESYSIHQNISKRVSVHPNVFCPELLPDQQQNLMLPDTATFQAILPLPYYFKFNLPFGSARSDKAIYGSMVSSIYSGLPIMSTYLSRPSITESLSIFKMVMPPPYKKAIPEIVKNDKNIAIIVHSSDTALLNGNEKLVIQHAKLWNASNEFLIYNLPISYFTDTLQPDTSLLTKVKKSGNEILRSSDSSNFYYYNGFDTLQSPQIYRGPGAFYGLKEQNNRLFQIPTTNMDTSDTYCLSFWYYNHLWDQTFTTALLIEKDSIQKILFNSYYSPIQTDLIDGWWYFSTHTFKITSTKSLLSFYISGSRKFENWFVVDELLIYPIHKTVIEKNYQNNSSGVLTNSR